MKKPFLAFSAASSFGVFDTWTFVLVKPEERRVQLSLLMIVEMCTISPILRFIVTNYYGKVQIVFKF